MTATSSAQIGANAAWAEGYTGAGSRVAIIDTGIDDEHISFDGDALLYSLEQAAAERDMSADEYIASLDLLDQDEISSVLGELNADVNAASAYVSEKIPYGYNYVDRNYNITHMTDTQEEHGSHVTGIAAANRFVPQAGSSPRPRFRTIIP